ncbi:MAG: ABC transporter substrate-binding protein [Erysipelotrichaceae bacterium]|nr:ABC transporter substrate-binding protein [Erysipelotrichaceae bacterium]
MKKLLTLLLALLMVVSLTACSGGSDSSTSGGDTAPASDMKTTQSLNVRKAISYAIDRATLATSLNDGSIAADGIIPHMLASNPETGADFREDAGVVVEYDAAKAQEFYAAACEELGKDSITLDLLYGTNEGDSVIKAAELIQFYLEEAGFSVNLVSKQKKERLSLMNTGDYEVALTRWGPDYGDPQTYMDLFVSTNTSNNSGRYNSPEFDALVADAESGVAASQRWQDWIDAEQQLVVTDAAICPVFQAGGAMLIRPGVTGLQFHSASVDNFRHVSGKDTITLLTNTDILSLDSCIATDGTSFSAQIMFTDGLTELDADGNPVPSIAESWDISDDGLTVTFHLRNDAKWSDGTPVTAADFVYAWDRIQSEAIASEYAWWVSDVMLASSYEAVDDYTLTVTTAMPNADLLLKAVSFNSSLPINQAFCEAQGDQYATTAETVLSNGPFVLDSWTPGYSYEFVLNENYYDYDAYVAAGAPSKVVFRVLEDTQTALMEYDAGNIDTVILSGEQVTANTSKEGFTQRLQGYLFYLSININHDKE